MKYRGLEKSVNAFECECFERGTPIASAEVAPRASEKLATVQVGVMSVKLLVSAVDLFCHSSPIAINSACMQYSFRLDIFWLRKASC